MTCGHYDTDLTDLQWTLNNKYLPKQKKLGREPLDRRRVLDVILYVKRTGCQRRHLPYDFKRRSSRQFVGKNDRKRHIVVDSLGLLIADVLINVADCRSGSERSSE
ncbi:MAG: transposase [Planctomycetaceae bacterium]|jgi:transposase|nr:transposase [Planctomycetaceae bacterium]